MNEKIKNQKTKKFVSMPLVNPNAAGIDVGDTLFTVAVPESSDTLVVKEFGAFTCDLRAISEWLKQSGIETVAMESTGVYWKQLFTVLVRDGFEVYLVNAKSTKNITGRKDDENDAMWIQRLHSCGLLTSCFLPDEHTETLRTLVRFRRSLVQDSSRYILRMQKSLELMNIKVHTVISDIVGKTGTAIIEAIIEGERRPEKFMPYIDKRIKADKQTLMKSLEGNWRREHLATLKLSYEMYKIFQVKIEECEKEIEKTLQEYDIYEDDKNVIDPIENTQQEDSSVKKKKKSKIKNSISVDINTYLKKIHGVDVMEIYGISGVGALEILSETGTDLSKWETENKWVSWLNLCPNNKIN